MIPLAQYLSDRDADGEDGFQSFGPAKPKRAARPAEAFSKLGHGAPQKSRKDEFRPLRQPVEDAGGPFDLADAMNGQEDGDAAFDLDTAALFAGMEDELRSRVQAPAPRRDARALQSALAANAPGIDHGKALAKAREAAHAEGRQAGLAEAAAEHDAALEAAIEAERQSSARALEEALESARAEWATKEGERLAALLKDQTERLAVALKMTLSSVLKPVALGARRRQSVDDVVEAIGNLSFDGRALSLTATGPSDLLASLKEALGDKASLMTFAPSETATELRIACDQTVIETRLAEWRTAIEDALA